MLRERSGELPRSGSHPSPLKPGAKSAPPNGKGFGWRVCTITSSFGICSLHQHAASDSMSIQISCEPACL